MKFSCELFDRKFEQDILRICVTASTARIKCTNTGTNYFSYFSLYLHERTYYQWIEDCSLNKNEPAECKEFGEMIRYVLQGLLCIKQLAKFNQVPILR